MRSCRFRIILSESNKIHCLYCISFLLKYGFIFPNVISLFHTHPKCFYAGIKAFINLIIILVDVVHMWQLHLKTLFAINLMGVSQGVFCQFSKNLSPPSKILKPFFGGKLKVMKATLDIKK